VLLRFIISLPSATEWT